MRALEIGPGRHPVDKNWTIVDMVVYPYVDLIHDVRIFPWPLADNKYDLVYMSHILEHIPWFKTVDALKEVYRILRTGGTTEIWVPDFEVIVSSYLNKKCGDTWRRNNSQNDYMVWLNGRIFTYGPGEENWHRAIFDEKYLRQCLREAGFRNTERLKKPRGYDHGAINLGVAAVK